MVIRIFESHKNLYCPDGWVGGWVGGWVDGWMGGWVDGWVGGDQKGPSIFLIFKYVNK